MKKIKKLAYDPSGALSLQSPARAAATPLELRDFREEQAPSAVWTAYHPTWRDNATDGILGFFGDKPSLATRTRVERLMGNATPATSDFVSPVDFTPAGAVFSADEAYRKYKLDNYSGAAWDAVGAVPGGALSTFGKGAKIAKRAVQRGADVSTGGHGLSEFRPRRGYQGSHAAINQIEVDPPIFPQRPFRDDYPLGAVADRTGKILEDLEGRKLRPGIVAGRRWEGKPDVTLSHEQLARMTKRTTGQAYKLVAPDEIEGNAGLFGLDPVTNVPTVRIANDLDPKDVTRVLAHENGHIIDRLAGRIPDRGLERELEAIYHSLKKGKPPEGNFWRPQHDGYSDASARREYIAEALRMYMTNPNAIKTIAPRTAARIREYVNPDPVVSKFIQFNSKILPMGLPMGMAYQLTPRIGEETPKRRAPSGRN
ncbi:hypothetical protein I6F26_13745 [Ensifer sp. IC3342]|nr:hypothetical protein [Ensifer sp. BRP08]MCA1447642.1 hypothetical protein [Ensifer sp. IC3342]